MSANSTLTGRFVFLIMPVTLALLMLACGGLADGEDGETAAVSNAGIRPSATPTTAAESAATSRPTATPQPTATPTGNATAVAATATARWLEELDYFPAATATAPAPIPTATPTTETVNGVQVVTFSEETSEGNSADDVLNELDYFVGGGGGDSPCWEERDAPYLNDFADDSVEIHARTTLDSCNWQLGEQVTVTIVDPGGNEQSVTLTADDPWETNTGRGEVSYTFKTDVLGDRPGVYTIRWAGESGVVEYALRVTAADGPRIYWNEDNTIILHNFRPGETVRIFVYVDEPVDDDNPDLGNRAHLYAVATFQVDRNGQLVIDPAFDRTLRWIGAIGDESGAIEPDWRSSAAPTMYPVAKEITWPVSDDGVEACRLPVAGLYGVSAGDGIMVTLTDEYVARNYRGETVGVLQSGQQVEVIAGTWWREVEGQSGAFGWHWQIVVPDSGDFVDVWQELFAECSHLQ